MARVKISEYQAKKILVPHYRGLPLTLDSTLSLIQSQFPKDNLVLKVDQGIKKRGKQGLVKVNLTPSDILPTITEWSRAGWSQFLVEPVIEHAPTAERYLALELTRSGWQISYSDKGGIDIESNWDSVARSVLRFKGQTSMEVRIKKYLDTLIPILESHHFVFLEMNPVIIRGSQVIPLDMAAEVDDAGSSLASIPDKNISDSERQITALDASTPASLKFKLINPAGRIWVLLSGGGASLVLADEVADQGMGETLANYGEYSGAPKTDDVYAYTKIILAQMLNPKYQQKTKKALVIAAGIANFTDVAKTFQGIIHALDEVKSELKRAHVKVFVRRGGPNEARGLQLMRDFLSGADIPHIIHPHTIPLTQVINDVKRYLSSGSNLKGSAQPDIIIQAGGKVRPSRNI